MRRKRCGRVEGGGKAGVGLRRAGGEGARGAGRGARGREDRRERGEGRGVDQHAASHAGGCRDLDDEGEHLLEEVVQGHAVREQGIGKGGKKEGRRKLGEEATTYLSSFLLSGESKRREGGGREQGWSEGRGRT